MTVRVHGHRRRIKRRVKKTVSGLVMPTTFIAQNGARIHQNTPVSVTGCAKARPVKKGKKAAQRHGKKK